MQSAEGKAWQSITKEETQSLVMSKASSLKAVIACKGFSTNYKKIHFIYDIYLSNYIWTPENGAGVHTNLCYIFIQLLELKL